MTDLNTTLGARISRRRRALKMTQDELGNLVGVRFQQIQKYESGHNAMLPNRIIQITKALGMPVAQLFEGL